VQLAHPFGCIGQAARDRDALRSGEIRQKTSCDPLRGFAVLAEKVRNQLPGDGDGQRGMTSVERRVDQQQLGRDGTRIGGDDREQRFLTRGRIGGERVPGIGNFRRAALCFREPALCILIPGFGFD
jgi:hypothetical protein